VPVEGIGVRGPQAADPIVAVELVFLGYHSWQARGPKHAVRGRVGSDECTSLVEARKTQPDGALGGFFLVHSTLQLRCRRTNRLREPILIADGAQRLVHGFHGCGRHLWCHRHLGCVEHDRFVICFLLARVLWASVVCELQSCVFDLQRRCQQLGHLSRLELGGLHASYSADLTIGSRRIRLRTRYRPITRCFCPLISSLPSSFVFHATQETFAYTTAFNRELNWDTARVTSLIVRS
jgi:hypothetical protein